MGETFDMCDTNETDYCDTCRVHDHDICEMKDGCTCCENTRLQQTVEDEYKKTAITPNGSWWLKSKTDPRWNCEGTSCQCGGLQMSPECEAMVEKLKGQLGAIPEDLEFGYTKY